MMIVIVAVSMKDYRKESSTFVRQDIILNQKQALTFKSAEVGI